MTSVHRKSRFKIRYLRSPRQLYVFFRPKDTSLSNTSSIFEISEKVVIMNKNENWTVVGISGSTNSGKTTLAKFLQHSFPGSVVVNQDTYFRPDDSKEHVLIPELNHKNWERLEAVNWNAMMEYVTRTLSSRPQSDKALCIIEGHIIFNYTPLEKICHKKYFLKMDKEACFRRRCTRVYDPPDIPGYFEKCVWPMYLTNLEELERKCSNIMFLDGTDRVDDIREKVMLDLKSYFSA